MRLVTFEIDGLECFGAVIGDEIVRLDGAWDGVSSVKSAIKVYHGRSWPPLPNQKRIALASVKLLPPIPDPGKIICVATNFHEGKPPPEYPTVFTRFAESLTGHAQHLRKPTESERYDFEGELAVIIGKHGYRIPGDQAGDYVAGYSCLNDGSVRDWQKHSSQFTPGKNFWRSGSMGPWLVTADEVPDVSELALETKVNGLTKQSIGMDRMIFDIPWLISYFSTFTPLSPGDVIATGTPSGFGSSRDPQEFLSAGDEIEVTISAIGTLKNVVETASP